jgi:hypothetical protein
MADEKISSELQKLKGEYSCLQLMGESIGESHAKLVGDN